MSTVQPTGHGLVGSVLEGSYRIDGLLGEGGMGAVYSATHLRLDKRVAVKVMARELAAAPDALMRFRREALVTGNLGHPNIVQVFDFSTTPTGEPFLVMEFLDGEDLERRLRRQGRLSPATTLHIVKQVAAALMATHAKGIVHRDLKPANIYLLEAAGAADFVKVLDFGISKVHSASVKLTKTSAIMGTPAYMSPEQAEGKLEDLDERTDQWALACITWECLAGEAPFVGDNIPSILLKVVSRPPPPLLPQVAGLHPQVEGLLLRALAKNKHDRFATVHEFAAALEAALVDAAAKPVPSVPRTVQISQTMADEGQVERPDLPAAFTRTAGEIDDEADLKDVRSKTWIWAATVGAAAILLVAALLLFRSEPAPKPVSATPPPAAVPTPMAQQPAPTLAQPAPAAPVPAAPAARAPGLAPAQPSPTEAAADHKTTAPERPGKERGPEARSGMRSPVPAAGEPKAARPPAPRRRVERRMIEDL